MLKATKTINGVRWVFYPGITGINVFRVNDRRDVEQFQFHAENMLHALALADNHSRVAVAA